MPIIKSDALKGIEATKWQYLAIFGIHLAGIAVAWFTVQTLWSVVYIIWQGMALSMLVAGVRSSTKWRRRVLWPAGIALLLSVAILILQAGVALYGIVLLGLLIMVTGGLIIIGVRLFGRKISFRWLLIPQSFAVVGLMFILISALLAPPAVPAADEPASEQLAYLHYTDQYDRQYGVFPLLFRRDFRRLERLHNLRARDAIQTANDRYHAAWILQHGLCRENYRLAHEYARDAKNEGVPGVDPQRLDFIYTATYDRWQLAQGGEQTSGTQVTIGGSGEQRSCDHPDIPAAVRPHD